ncbi:MAG: DUF2752 domain-containing protein [Myxococcaceae bacterium]
MSDVLDRTITWRIVVQPLLQPAMRIIALVVLIGSIALPAGPLGPDLCPVHRATGLPCPGCGVTRGLMYVSHGQLAEALGANPWVVVLWPALVLLALSVVVPAPAMNRFDALIARWEPWPSRVVRVLLVAFFGFGMVRMLAFLISGEAYP